MGPIDFLRNAFGKWFDRAVMPETVINQAFGATSAVSTTMENNIALWYSMFVDRPPWQCKEVRTVGLPAAITKEFVRATLAEAAVNVAGSNRAEALNEVMGNAVSDILPAALQVGLALGAFAVKPVLANGEIQVDYCGANDFTPTAFDDTGRAIGGVFKRWKKVGVKYYCKLENHSFQRDGDRTVYTVQNRCYESDQQGNIGAPAKLSDVPEWADIAEEVVISNLERPLFAYFKTPSVNNVDMGSEAGVSIYGGSTVDLIRAADEMWERFIWEYKSAERKIFADLSQTEASDFESRLFEFGGFGGYEGRFFEVFSPEIRNEAVYSGFQRILQQIEFNTGLAFGDISDPQSVQKTATEIRASKQRKYATINGIQKQLESTLDDLCYSVSAFMDIYGIGSAGEYTLVCSWGDSVLDDAESLRQERAMDIQEVAAGLMNPYEYRMKWYGEDADTAKANLPSLDSLITEQQREIE